MEAIDAASHRLSGPWCRGFLLVCLLDGHCHVLRLTVKDTMVLQLSHVEGRARDGHAYDVQCRRLPELQVALSPVRFCRALGQPLELLAGARPPKQHAARKQLAYLGLQDGDALLTDVAWPRQPKNPWAEELEGFQIASWSSAGHLVMLAPRPKATTWRSRGRRRPPYCPPPLHGLRGPAVRAAAPTACDAGRGAGLSERALSDLNMCLCRCSI